MKGVLSRGVRLFREGVKYICGRASAITLGKKCYPLFGIPCGLTSGLEPNEGSQDLLYPAVFLAMHYPKAVDDIFQHNFQSATHGAELPKAGILKLAEGTATRNGGNLSLQGKLVTTFLQPIDGKPPHQDEHLRFSTKKFFPTIYHVDEPIVTLATAWQGAFYHWMYEVLPRLHLAEKAGYQTERLYVDSALRFQKESLELLGVKLGRVINAKEYTAVRAPQVIIPSIPLIPTDWACHFLRERFLPKLSKRSRFRLYVSRNDATRRRIFNEEEVVALLKKYGFERRELSTLSFKEQAELFQAAEVVIGPHGAGFSHLVFCQPGISILEIFSPKYFNSCYWHVCNRVGLSYHYLCGEEKSEHSSSDPDIEVSLPKLEATLNLMGLYQSSKINS